MIDRLSVEALALARGERTLFSGLTLSLNAGEAVALTGANGAGKTSLLRAVAGLLQPLAGAIGFWDQATLLDADVARAGGRAPARPSRWAEAWAHRRGGAGLLDALAGRARHRGRHLGAGAQAAAGAGRCASSPPASAAGWRSPVLLAAPRPLWLLDEPLAPLDADRRARFGRLMQAHLDGGGMVLAAVHDPLPVAARPFAVGSA